MTGLELEEDRVRNLISRQTKSLSNSLTFDGTSAKAKDDTLDNKRFTDLLIAGEMMLDNSSCVLFGRSSDATKTTFPANQPTHLLNFPVL